MKNDSLSRRFMQRSPDGLRDEELLELLLRYCREDAGDMARRIMERFPNIAVIMEADAEDLSTVEGMDGDTVLLLRLTPLSSQLVNSLYLCTAMPCAALTAMMAELYHADQPLASRGVAVSTALSMVTVLLLLLLI